MKRFLTSLVTVLLLTMALTVAASASDFDAAAKDLSAIGVFRGTEAGFELDRAPTRSEAAIMLVRLYGAEEQAAADYEAGTISHPFTDVSDFTAPRHRSLPLPRACLILPCLAGLSCGMISLP